MITVHIQKNGISFETELKKENIDAEYGENAIRLPDTSSTLVATFMRSWLAKDSKRYIIFDIRDQPVIAKQNDLPDVEDVMHLLKCADGLAPIQGKSDEVVPLPNSQSARAWLNDRQDRLLRLGNIERKCSLFLNGETASPFEIAALIEHEPGFSDYRHNIDELEETMALEIMKTAQKHLAQEIER